MSSQMRKITAILAVVGSIALGSIGAITLASETSGYIAGYTWFGIMLIGIPLVGILSFLGAALILSSKAIRTGILLVASACAIVASYVITFKAMDRFDRVLYKREKM